MGNRAWSLKQGCIGLLGLLGVGGCMEDPPPRPGISRPVASQPQALGRVTKVMTFSGSMRAEQLVSFDDWLLVGLLSSSFRDVGLWRSDGTVPGTQRLHQASHSEGGSFSMAPLGARVLFSSGAELWSTDVTPEGTARLKALPSPSVTLRSTGTHVFLVRNRGGVLWQSDGTEAGTQAVVGAPLLVRDVFVSQGRAWFSGVDSFWGEEPWTSDGTPGGTRMLLNIGPGSRDCTCGEFTPLGHLTYFGANGRNMGLELWKSDGTPEGTSVVVDLAPGDLGSGPSDLYPWKDDLYFWTVGIGMPQRLYRSDGTEAGTRLVSPVVSRGDDIAADFQDWGDVLFFVASDNTGTGGTELWRTDGTPEGTALVADLNPGAGSSNPGSFTLMSPEGPLFFVATTPDTGRELWRVDSPTAQPTVVEVLPGTGSSNPSNLTVQGPVLYFTANDGTGEGLFKLPGLVADTRPPRVTCPADQTVAATGPGGAEVSFPQATARDDSGETPSIRADHESGALFPVGVTEVTVTAEDSAGNRASCAFDVTVEPWVVVDAGTEEDGGTLPSDGGMEMDAGVPPVDGGTEPDAGVVDGGAEDAGSQPSDAGETDAGSEPTDAGSEDAGTTDAGTPDGGSSEEPPPDSGCGCQSTSASVPWSLMLLGLFFQARRHTRERITR